MTRQRAAILEVLHSDKKHHTAEEIFDLTKKKLPEISRATVYNNLRALEGERLIRKISGEGGPDRYDNSFVPHGHLFCTACGGIFDIEMPGFSEALSDCIKSDVESYELKVRGLCLGCRRCV